MAFKVRIRLESLLGNCLAWLRLGGVCEDIANVIVTIEFSHRFYTETDPDLLSPKLTLNRQTKICKTNSQNNLFYVSVKTSITMKPAQNLHPHREKHQIYAGTRSPV